MSNAVEPVPCQPTTANEEERKCWLNQQYLNLNDEFQDLLNGDHPWQIWKQKVV